MLPKSDREIEIWAGRLLEPDRKHLNIEPAEGAFLRDVVVRLASARALEIGTSNGYSGIWIAMGLRRTRGKLVTVEADPGRHALALESFRSTGLAQYVDARLGDAFDVVPELDGPLDFAFLDAVKSDYLKYLDMVLPKMRPGGAVVAHNVKSHPEEMAGFLERIRTDPGLETEIVTPGKQGFSVTFVR